MSPNATILIYGHDPILLDTRRWVLEKAGFQVLTVGERRKAEKIVASDSIDLLLLCHTLTSEERRAALSTASALQPKAKRLVMMTTSQEAGQAEIEGESLHIFAGAVELIAAARKLLD